MTLLVIGITVPVLSDPGSIDELADALGDRHANFISFTISFLVIGRYWVAHHQFFSLLRAADLGLVWLNVIYLGFVAFLPFPTALLGTYFENPLSIVIYAPAVAAVSGMEVVLFRHAHRKGLMIKKIPPDVYRWGVLLSVSPVIVFMLSIPLAFVDTALAAASWLLAIPFQAIAQRWKPENADDFLVAG